MFTVYRTLAWGKKQHMVLRKVEIGPSKPNGRRVSRRARCNRSCHDGSSGAGYLPPSLPTRNASTKGTTGKALLEDKLAATNSYGGRRSTKFVTKLFTASAGLTWREEGSTRRPIKQYDQSVATLARVTSLSGLIRD